MTSPPPSPHDDPPEDDLGPINPLFTDPPDPGPIPEVLRQPARAAKPPDRSSDTGDLAAMGSAWGMATDFFLTIIAGLAVGWLIDRWQGTEPWGLVIGLGVGFVAALVRIIRRTQQADRAEAAARAKR